VTVRVVELKVQLPSRLAVLFDVEQYGVVCVVVHCFTQPFAPADEQKPAV
jgi:hypothetical protein